MIGSFKNMFTHYIFSKENDKDINNYVNLIQKSELWKDLKIDTITDKGHLQLLIVNIQ